MRSEPTSSTIPSRRFMWSRMAIPQSCSGPACGGDAPASLQFFAHEIEPLERRLVGHDEQVGIAFQRLMRRKGPVRNREHVVLRPFEARLADRRSPAAAD